MSLITIGDKQVHVEDGSDSVKHAVDFLNQHPDDAASFFEAAHHDHINGVAHFSTNRPSGYVGATDFTIIHNGDGTYNLRKKEHHMF